jgi:hypothetical protein
MENEYHFQFQERNKECSGASATRRAGSPPHVVEHNDAAIFSKLLERVRAGGWAACRGVHICTRRREDAAAQPGS